MSEQTYELEFRGYWREPAKGGIPNESGIYCVYSCVHNETEKTVSIKKLIYIGESGDVKARIANHEKFNDWKKYVKQGEVLCFSFASVPSASRVRCESAMIFEHEPPVNTEYTQAFSHDKTTISLFGKTNLLNTSFSVKRT